MGCPKSPKICNSRNPEFVSGSDDQEYDITKQIRDESVIDSLDTLSFLIYIDTETPALDNQSNAGIKKCQFIIIQNTKIRCSD